MTSKVKIREAGKTDIPILAQHNQALATRQKILNSTPKQSYLGFPKL